MSESADGLGFSMQQESLDDGRHVVAVVGEVTLVTAPRLKRAVVDAVAAGGTRLVIDLTAELFTICASREQALPAVAATASS